MKQRSNIIVISLGGSLVYPKQGIDTRFIRQFRSLVLGYVRRGWRFVIICGGGALARQYQEALQHVGVHDASELDWIGIYSCRMNAYLLRMALGAPALETLITKPSLVRQSSFGTKRIIFGGGEKPGQTSDHVAVQCAINTQAAALINLSNIDYIYDRDPKMKGAKPLRELSWEKFKKLFPKKHTPGAHVPFDPRARALAEHHRLTVAFLGSNIKNLDLYLQGKAFRGTRVSRD